MLTAVFIEFTVTVIVAVAAHWPALGVKVYIVVALLFIAGLHVPPIPFVEVVGNVNDPPGHMAAICENNGATLLFTVIVIVAVVAHWPALGVKVYVVVALLFTPGLHVPPIPFVEVVGNVNDPPGHMAATCENNGTTLLFTVIVIVAVVAHWPALGVKVYVVVALLFTAGLHVPVIPFVEVVGNVNDAPWQIAATCENSGATLLFTVTVIVAVVAHWPAFGVKVYVVVALLFIAGLHVPVIPFVEVVGNVNDAPWQIAATCENNGATSLFTVTVIVAVVAHWPALGVKVYVVVALLFIAGLQIPVIPFVEVVGNVNEPPGQMAATCENNGATLLLTVIEIPLLVNEDVVAHEALLVSTQVTTAPFAKVEVV